MNWTAVVLSFALGAGVSATLFGAFRSAKTPSKEDEKTSAENAGDLLEFLAEAGLVVDSNGVVIAATSASMAMGLVLDRRLEHRELVNLAAKARESGELELTETELLSGIRGSRKLFVSAKAIRLEDQSVLVTVEDRTEAKRLDETRRDFVANISHELKTPVGAIGLLAEAIQNSTDNPEAVKKLSENVFKESKRLSSLVQDIIQLSRIQAAETTLNKELIDLQPVVRDAIDRNSFKAERRSVTVDFASSGEVFVFGDEEMLSVAIKNIIENAIVYSPEGSRVGVALAKKGNVAEVTVTDSGVGISKQDQKRIFERFYRTDPARSRQTGGTGLGLSIVKHVIESHLGEIKLFSKPGVGSTFTLRLPVADKKLLTTKEKVTNG